jgi:hypothetical protein
VRSTSSLSARSPTASKTSGKSWAWQQARARTSLQTGQMKLQAMFDTADVEAICEELADNAGDWDGSYDADTVNTKFVLMAGVVGHDLLDAVNEQCLVSFRWMLTAGASD